MKLVIRLRDELEERGVSQKTLAEMTGLRPATISELCNNFRVRVDLSHLEKIANALDITDVRKLIDFDIKEEAERR